MPRTSDLNVLEVRPLPTPDELQRALPRTEAQTKLVTEARQAVRRILRGEDPRLLAIVGPCSIHDLRAAREYAERLAALAGELSDRLMIVMRVYFEKPRTSVGWKGLIFDPHLDGSGDLAQGLRLARGFLREVLDLGLPTGTELLDPISPQYIADLICWTAIGARTSESQTHRQLASGLSMPLGFKNNTAGSIQNAINAIRAARQAQTFFGIGSDGRAAAVRTRGNPDCHIVLRGGANGPNFSAMHVAAAETMLHKAAMPSAIMVDCGHDNCGRQPELQPVALNNVVGQVTAGNRSIVGVMLESNLFAGTQPLVHPKVLLRYGVSITDGCLDWTTTERCLREAHASLRVRLTRATDLKQGWDERVASESCLT